MKSVNWFDIKYDNTDNKRKSWYDDCVLDIQSNCIIPKNVQNFKQEVRKTCLNMKDYAFSNGNSLGVFISGGADSQVIATEFSNLNISFTPFFVEFIEGYNKHEKEFVDRLSKRHNLNVETIRVSLDDWLSSNGLYRNNGYIEYVKKYGITSITQPLMLWARNEISDKSITMTTGSSEPRLGKKAINVKHVDEKGKIKNVWCHHFSEYMKSIENFQTMNSYNDYSFFYMSRPEIYYSYITDSIIEDMVGNPYKMHLAATKNKMIEYYYPSLKGNVHHGSGYENFGRNKIIKYCKEGYKHSPCLKSFYIEHKQLLSIMENK